MEHLNLILIFTGLLAGFVDAIAGGGGIITLPVWSLIYGAGALAVGTNKIVGTLASLVAFLVYLKNHQFHLKKGLLFVVAITLGSFIGAKICPKINPNIFYYLMLFMCPIIGILVYKKDQIFNKKNFANKNSHFFIAGFFCGIYDGFFGPGGGTFMFLSLLFLTNLSLLESLTLSKFANFVSALTALVTYEAQGLVDWKNGLIMGVTICIGAYFGARLTSKKAQTIIRPVLFVILTLIFIRLLSIIVK